MAPGRGFMFAPASGGSCIVTRPVYVSPGYFLTEPVCFRFPRPRLTLICGAKVPAGIIPESLISAD